MMSLAMREETLFKKAYELSTLCGNEVCVIYYGCDGEPIKTWPKDKAKVRDMAERFSRLSDREKHKKSTNLLECLAKKMSKEKMDDFYKFSHKLSEMEYSLERSLPILQDRLRLLLSDSGGNGIPQPNINLSTDDPPHQQWADPLANNRLSELSILQDQLRLPSLDDISSDYCGIPQPLVNFSTLLSDGPPKQQWTEPLVNDPLCDLPSLNHHHDQTKYSIFMCNHENGNFTKLASSFDQSAIPFNNMISTALLGTQGFGGCNNNNNNIVDLLPPPPLMLTFPTSYY